MYILICILKEQFILIYIMNTIDDLNISTLTALTSIENNIDIEKLYNYIQKIIYLE